MYMFICIYPCNSCRVNPNPTVYYPDARVNWRCDLGQPFVVSKQRHPSQYGQLYVQKWRHKHERTHIHMSTYHTRAHTGTHAIRPQTKSLFAVRAVSYTSTYINSQAVTQFHGSKIKPGHRLQLRTTWRSRCIEGRQQFCQNQFDRNHMK